MSPVLPCSGSDAPNWSTKVVGASRRLRAAAERVIVGGTTPEGWVSPEEGLAFVRRHGIGLQAARGPVPSLAEEIAGRPIRGSWWGHPKGHEIFRVADAVSESDEVLVCKLVDGKVTYVHRRLWP